MQALGRQFCAKPYPGTLMTVVCMPADTIDINGVMNTQIGLNSNRAWYEPSTAFNAKNIAETHHLE